MWSENFCEESMLRLSTNSFNVHQKVYSNWINSTTKSNIKSIFELSNSLKLKELFTFAFKGANSINLPFPNPASRQQHISNVRHLFGYLEKHVRLIGVNAPDIVDGNQKIILGFVWLIIKEFDNFTIDTSQTSSLDIESLAANNEEIKKTIWPL